ncbi:hypothetical protein POTOM_025432 [Populus tomentosa]|uniref:Membrane-associated 30 kDa protein n=1 Tax=Populus tomentosa TaxID=118781 RepID=A0A8X7ZJ44_POPTO|nr:hypothetical protein POTOM_025432 [Populus tomentosa]
MAIKSQLISGLTLPLPHPPSTSSSSNNNSNNNTILSLVKRRNLKTSFFNGGGVINKETLLDDFVISTVECCDCEVEFVEALKITRIRTGLSTRSHCYGQGGGALGTRMNLFDRFARVVKSYANAILSSFEDPEKILEQTVLEMNDDLTKMRQATAQVLASQKRLENKYNAAQKASEEWYRKAQLALQKGEEDLAREALKRRKTYAVSLMFLKETMWCLNCPFLASVLRQVSLHYKAITILGPKVHWCDCKQRVVQKLQAECGSVVQFTKESLGKLIVLLSFLQDNANSFKAQLDQQRGVVENLISNTRLLESKIQEAKSKKDTLKARAQSAKLTATKVNEMLGNVNTSNALSAFEKMEEKGKVFGTNLFIEILFVLAMESEAEALGQLTTNELDGKFALLEGSSVDDDLENLKKELAGSSKKGELPPGRTVVTSSNNPFRDPDIEMELNELRQKRNNF